MDNDKNIFNSAKKFFLSGNFIEAKKLLLTLIKNYRNNYELYFLLGTISIQLKKNKEAINYLNIAIDCNPKFPESYNNRGVALAEEDRYLEALENYDKAIRFKKNYIDAYLNKAISLNKLKKFDEAFKITKMVINFDPLNAKAHNGLGSIFHNIKNFEEAIKSYKKAIKIKPNFLMALNNLASSFHELSLFDKALFYYYKVFEKDPNFENLLANIASSKMKIYDWSDLDKIVDLIKKKIVKNEISVEPILIHYLSDDLELIKKNTEKWVLKNVINFSKKNEVNYSKSLKKFEITKKNNNKIKIGYFSADFHDHVVLHVMTNIFINHDTSRFEIYGFSHGKRDGGPLRNKIEQYFTKFFLINDMSDEEVVSLVKSKEIDIAINLTGLTKNHRTGIFANRMAPVQVNYLGYPGTFGMKSMDIIIADKKVISENEKKYYSEKIKYLPQCFMPNPKNLLSQSKKNYLRSDFDLPENKIVFCAIHNPLKINSKIFKSWVQILKRTKDSILWLNAKDEISKKNIINEFKKQNLDVNRFIFAKRVKENNDHLKRLELADIFLDTYPYSSHSTAYDYISAGLPMITLRGNSYASKVAASIYLSINMDELIANNFKDYENIAINLANDVPKLNNLRKKIKMNIKNSIISDGKKFTENLEKIYADALCEKLKIL